MTGLRLITIAEFERRLGIKRTTFLQWQRRMPNFPQRIEFSRSNVKYIEREADNFISAIRNEAANSGARNGQ